MFLGITCIFNSLVVCMFNENIRVLLLHDKQTFCLFVYNYTNKTKTNLKWPYYALNKKLIGLCINVYIVKMQDNKSIFNDILFNFVCYRKDFENKKAILLVYI